MNHLFKAKDYAWSLFIGHLVMEKLLKAYYIKIIDENYPMIHNLLRLAEKSGLSLTDEQQTFFATMTSFNINTRYDDYKKNFTKLCTKEYTEKWLNQIKENRLWMKRLLLT